MNTDPYSFARLTPDEVERIRALEEQLSAESGSPVTLIAYRPANERADGSRTSASSST